MAVLSPEAQAALSSAGLSWLPVELLAVWVDAWSVTGSTVQATNEMRASPSYSTYYPGNTNPNGTTKMSEAEYESELSSYRNVVEEAGLNPDLWSREDYARLIEGEVWAEEWRQRVTGITVGVRQRSDQVRQFYAARYGIQPTDAEIIASVMDPALGDARIAERIRTAEIGGAASEKGFSIDDSLADRLEDIGLDYQQAEALFREAGINLPMLDRLSRRHRDPVDSFDLNDYLDAAAFGTPEAVMQVRRMTAAETSQFRTPRDAFVDQRTGDATGLIDR